MQRYYTTSGFSSTTLEQHHVILHSALKAAQRQGLVTCNVATLDMGKPRRTEGHPDGNSNVYLTRRIARDRPDILARVKAGEFTSVRDAAREAGMIKDVSLVEQILRLWERDTRRTADDLPEARRAG